MVEETFKYAATPDCDETAAAAWSDIQTCREVYNHALTQEYRPRPDYDKPSYREMQNKITAWKDRWPEWSTAYSKCLQMAVRRIKQSESVLESLQARGYGVGRLKWKPPHEFRSIVYNQSGFDVANNTDRTNHAIVNFSKIGDFHLNYHRSLPDDGDITQVILKKEKTGDWTVSILVDYDPEYPENPAVEDIAPEDTVGIDLGITKFIYDSDGRSFESLDDQCDRDRIERRHRNLSRKEHGSNNWEKQRRGVAKIKRRIKRRVEDFQHKLTTWLVTTYDAVFVEDLNVSGMLQQRGNARNKQDAAWRGFIEMLEYKGDLYGTHVVQVGPAGTTKECAECGVETDKPLWVREHSCPSCGFEADRDANASYNVLFRGLQELGLGQAESTPVETATAVETDGEQPSSVPVSRVVETGSLGA